MRAFIGDDVDRAGDNNSTVGLRGEIASSSRLGDIFLAHHSVGRVPIDALRGSSLARQEPSLRSPCRVPGDRQRVKQLTCGLRAQRPETPAYRVKNNGVLEFGGSGPTPRAGDECPC